ncbi:MAG: hypothetical protein A2W19_15975 [Spirochaetes bacterium RBG_16_49_21]|nr:MAG: hypothetical protein A2W19_15975 [Spirochaetes bacterium RBG_16_49_21]
MKQKTPQVLLEFSNLSSFDRAELVEPLIESFDAEPDDEIKKAWAEEAEQRLADYRNGMADTVSEKEVFWAIKNHSKETR